MKIAICDDEKIFLSEIRGLIEEVYSFTDKTEISEFNDGSELLMAAKTQKFDIFFLDIEMEGKNGIETAKIIREKDSKAIIVFFTSHSEYAVIGYEVNAFRYLLKNSPKAYYIKELKSVYKEYLQRHYVYEVRTPKEIFSIPITDILYFEIYGRKIILHTARENYVYSGKMAEIEADGRLIGFIKPYKSYYVNMSYIKKINAKSITLTNNDEIPISRLNTAAVTEKYTAFITEGF